MRIFKEHREEGHTENYSLLAAKKKYPNVVLKKVRHYKSTKQLHGNLTGSHPSDMQQKRGRKRRASVGTFVALKRAILNYPKTTDADLVTIINV